MLVGNITVVQECGEKDVISLRVRFPSDYPHREPSTADMGRRFVRTGANHVNPDGTFCLWTPEESRWDARDPVGLQRYLEYLTVYLDKQLVYEVTKTWPGQQRAHGDAGREEALRELAACDEQAARIARRIVEDGKGCIGRKAPCPCKSGLSFDKCHRREAIRTADVLRCLPNVRFI